MSLQGRISPGRRAVAIADCHTCAVPPSHAVSLLRPWCSRLHGTLWQAGASFPHTMRSHSRPQPAVTASSLAPRNRGTTGPVGSPPILKPRYSLVHGPWSHGWMGWDGDPAGAPPRSLPRRIMAHWPMATGDGAGRPSGFPRLMRGKGPTCSRWRTCTSRPCSEWPSPRLVGSHPP